MTKETLVYNHYTDAYVNDQYVMYRHKELRKWVLEDKYDDNRILGKDQFRYDLAERCNITLSNITLDQVNFDFIQERLFTLSKKRQQACINLAHMFKDLEVSDEEDILVTMYNYKLDWSKEHEIRLCPAEDYPEYLNYFLYLFVLPMEFVLTTKQRNTFIKEFITGLTEKPWVPLLELPEIYKDLSSLDMCEYKDLVDLCTVLQHEPHITMEQLISLVSTGIQPKEFGVINLHNAMHKTRHSLVTFFKILDGLYKTYVLTADDVTPDIDATLSVAAINIVLSTRLLEQYEAVYNGPPNALYETPEMPIERKPSYNPTELVEHIRNLGPKGHYLFFKYMSAARKLTVSQLAEINSSGLRVSKALFPHTNTDLMSAVVSKISNIYFKDINPDIEEVVTFFKDMWVLLIHFYPESVDFSVDTTEKLFNGTDLQTLFENSDKPTPWPMSTDFTETIIATAPKDRTGLVTPQPDPIDNELLVDDTSIDNSVTAIAVVSASDTMATLREKLPAELQVKLVNKAVEVINAFLRDVEYLQKFGIFNSIEDTFEISVKPTLAKGTNLIDVVRALKSAGWTVSTVETYSKRMETIAAEKHQEVTPVSDARYQQIEFQLKCKINV